MEDKKGNNKNNKSSSSSSNNNNGKSTLKNVEIFAEKEKTKSGRNSSTCRLYKRWKINAF